MQKVNTMNSLDDCSCKPVLLYTHHAQKDINNMFTCSQSVAEQDRHTYMTEHIPRECAKLREDMQRDAARGTFHTNSYDLWFRDRIADSIGCKTIADSVLSYFPGLCVEYNCDNSDYGYGCKVYVRAAIEPGREHESKLFGEIKGGYWGRSSGHRFYTGPDSASCQALADRLNGMNSADIPYQVVCKATTKARNMCKIDVERVSTKGQGIVRGLFSRFTE